MSTTATNRRVVHGAFIIPGHHLWVETPAGDCWAGPRVDGTYYNDETDEIEVRTVNGGLFYVRPFDSIEVCNHLHPLGDLAIDR